MLYIIAKLFFNGAIPIIVDMTDTLCIMFNKILVILSIYTSVTFSVSGVLTYMVVNLRLTNPIKCRVDLRDL